MSTRCITVINAFTVTNTITVTNITVTIAAPA